MKTVKLLQIKKVLQQYLCCHKAFLHCFIGLILYKHNLFLFLLFLFLLLFSDSTSKILDAITVTFKNENFILKKF